VKQETKQELRDEAQETYDKATATAWESYIKRLKEIDEASE